MEIYTYRQCHPLAPLAGRGLGRGAGCFPTLSLTLSRPRAGEGISLNDVHSYALKVDVFSYYCPTQ